MINNKLDSISAFPLGLSQKVIGNKIYLMARGIDAYLPYLLYCILQFVMLHSLKSPHELIFRQGSKAIKQFCMCMHFLEQGIELSPMCVLIMVACVTIGGPEISLMYSLTYYTNFTRDYPMIARQKIVNNSNTNLYLSKKNIYVQD